MKEAQACVPFAKRMSTARFAVSMQRIKWLRRLKPPSASSNAGCQSPSYQLSPPARCAAVVRLDRRAHLHPSVYTSCASMRELKSCQCEVPQALCPAVLSEEFHAVLSIPCMTSTIRASSSRPPPPLRSWASHIGCVSPSANWRRGFPWPAHGP